MLAGLLVARTWKSLYNALVAVQLLERVLRSLASIRFDGVQHGRRHGHGRADMETNFALTSGHGRWRRHTREAVY